MNCDGKGVVPTNGPTAKPSPGTTIGPTPSPSCTDKSQHCNYWARNGECQKNPSYMNESCRKSCNLCNGGGGGGQNCNDKSRNCNYWASTGECSRNPAYMRPNCAKSCNFC